MSNTYIISIFISASSRCRFEDGDGRGGTEQKISSFMTQSACIDACVARQRVNSRINGVTISKNSGCWCEVGMTFIVRSTIYETCYLTSNKTAETATRKLFVTISLDKRLPKIDHLFISKIFFRC